MATLVGTQKDLGELLEQLIELDYDAIEAYDAAINRLEDASYRARMGEFRDDHRRHTQELSNLMRQSGREPPTGPDRKALLTQGKVMLAGLVGNRAILLAMKSNEEDTNTAYELASTNDAVPTSVRDILRGNLADERRHRAWIEQQLEVLRAASSRT